MSIYEGLPADLSVLQRLRILRLQERLVTARLEIDGMAAQNRLMDDQARALGALCGDTDPIEGLPELRPVTFEEIVYGDKQEGEK